jgi:thiamine biosynthesis lipoprotein
MSSNHLGFLTIKKKHHLAVVLLFLCFSACSRSPELYVIRGETMGTTYTVKVYTDLAVNEDEMREGIHESVERINRLMSNWKPDSDISRFNTLPQGASLSVAEETLAVIKLAKQIYEQTNGVLDPTLSPLIELWGFGTKDRDKVPTEEQIQAAKAKVGMDKFEINGNRLTRSTDGVTLNLSSIAKGYGVDAIAEHLQGLGHVNFFIEVGGETRMTGAGPRGAWRVGIEDPRSTWERRPLYIVQPGSNAFGTAGDYRNFFEEEGQRYTHILDPRTGYPIASKIASASILAADCATADGLATALTILGEEQAIELVESLEGIECVLLIWTEDNGLREVRSSGMSDYILESFL